MKNTRVIGIVVILLVVGLFGMVLYSKRDSSETNVEPTTAISTLGYINVTADMFKSMIETEPDVFVVDVHTPEQQHINGTDAFIPYNEIGNRPDKLPRNKNAKILVYCRSGGMSAIASKTLVKSGYTNVFNLKGGKNAYDRYVKEQFQEVKNDVLAIEITPKNQELGTVVLGDVTETTFTIKNNSNKTVKLTKVTTSCGCTKAFPSKDVLEPDEEVEMKVIFDPAVHGDDTDLGELTRTIYVETDLKDVPTLENTITANVVKGN